MLAKLSKFAIYLAILTINLKASPVRGDLAKQRLAKSQEILQYLNFTVDPCEDFYDFVCGNFDELNPTEIRVDIFSILEKEYDRKVLAALTKNSPRDTEMEKNVRNFYESCINIDSNVYKEKMKGIVSEFGQMPALEGNKWRENQFDWLKTVAKISHKYGIKLILRAEIMPPNTDNNAQRLLIAAEDLKSSVAVAAIWKKYGLAEETIIASKLREYLGLERDLALTVGTEIVDFKANLAAACERMDDTLKNPTTIAKMQSKYLPDIDIKQFVNLTLGSIPNYAVEDQLSQCHQQLVNLLKRTPKKIVANYVYYFLLKEFMTVNVPGQQTKLCIMETNTRFPMEMDFMAYRNELPKKMEEDLEKFWITIKLTFQSILQSPRLSWIRDSTTKSALDKLRAMKLEIGLNGREDFLEKFQKLKLNKYDYVENIKEIFAFEANQTRVKLSTSTQQSQAVEKESTPFTSRPKNTIFFPVTSLQPHYLWSDVSPNALKFATLGFLTSHELVHGFDDKGVFYNNLGQFKYWWDKRSFVDFFSRMECFTEQYRKYNYNGDSQSENIADNGGLHLAYEAYLKWYEDTLRFHQSVGEETLPGLNYTNRQLFFVGFGQLFCSNTDAELNSLDTSDFGHVPNKYRVNGPLSNLDEFSKEFNCRKGSAMNPSKKCVMY